ncbi:MAG: hypothetical protein JSS12_10650, partial [Verrucomicrobia bacterium]|nr:hypothetical protein [Verrucomicrobiota bacterium]
MKRILKWALCLLVVVGVTVAVVSSNKKKDKTNSKQPIMVVDFDESLGKGCNDYSYIFANPEDVKRYEILKGIYETNSLNTVQESSTPKIPKILHQIWVGPKTPPTYFVTFQEKWKTLHPDWEYHLWTDSELEDLNLELKDLIDASPNYAEKSDIIRSELLDRFGGVYLDVDMDPFHALDELHKKYDFYCGIENPHKIATTN